MASKSEIREAWHAYADAVDSGDLVARIAASIRMNALVDEVDAEEQAAPARTAFAPTDCEMTQALTFRSVDRQLTCDCGSPSDTFERALAAARETVAYMNSFLSPAHEVIT